MGNLRAWLLELRSCLSSLHKAEEARERRIIEECKKRRVERARFFLVLSNLTLLYQIPMAMVLVNRNQVNLAESTLMMAIVLGRIAMALLSSRLTARALDACYCFHILAIVAWTLAHDPSPGAIIRLRTPTLLCLLYWSVAALKPWLNAMGFFCVATAESLKLISAGGASSAVQTWFLYLVGLAGILALDYCLRTGVRMGILVADSENELEAIKTLLDGICDVVVQLDGRLRLKQHSPKLADLLMIQARRSLEGEDLRAHMAGEAEAATITRHLQASMAAAAHASVFHAKMRDSAGSNIDMEFFSVGFIGRDGDQRHILGMREFTDIRPVLPPQRPLRAPAPQLLSPTPQVAREAVLPPPPLAQHQRSLSPRMVGALPSALPPPPEPQQEATVRAPRRQAQGFAGFGTPPVLERGDIRSHRSPSSRLSSSSSDPALEGEHSDSGPGETLALETSHIAMEVTVNYLLMSWALQAPRGACCWKHTALLRLQSLVSGMRAANCDQGFGPVMEWQCPRCGVTAEEYQDPRHRRRCLLCKHFGGAQVQKGGGSSSSLTPL